MDLKQYTKLKQQTEKLQRAADRAEGALAQLMTQLEEEFGCSTVAKAEKLLQKLWREEKQANEDFRSAMQEFKEKFGPLIKLITKGDINATEDEDAED